MSFVDQPAAREGRIPYINDRFLADEVALVSELADIADPGPASRDKIQATAAQLVAAVRKNSKADGGIEAFLQQATPALLYRNAIGSAETVTNNQYDSRWRRSRQDQKQQQQDSI